VRLPPLTDEELAQFLREGLWVAKIATHNEDGSIRMTPLEYAVGEDGDIIFSTWENSAAVRNLRRDSRASVLIDRADQPHAGVHYTGQAQTGPETTTPEEHAKLFGRYVGNLDEAARWYENLISLELGQRAYIRFRPAAVITWDFGKIQGT
jgi:PPOX class probable F420-dependent enzyme